MFLRSPEMFILIKKLFWSCHPNPTRFGPKRRLLDIEYQRLCSVYDQFVYSNQELMEYLSADPSMVGTISELLTDSFGMNETEAANFKQDLMTYATNNMVKITTYIESPYVNTYQTDQVCVRCHILLFWPFILLLGDVSDNPHRQPGRHDGTLSRILLCQRHRDSLFHILCHDKAADRNEINSNCTSHNELERALTRFIVLVQTIMV